MFFRAFALSILVPLSVAAADKAVVNGKLKMEALNKAYLESEWESLGRQLEAFLKSRPTDSLPVRDRIAAYKYLGTIYAADSLTRTRAEANFLLLLDLSPEIEIADLYVSNGINDFFQGIKRKHRAQKEYESKYDAYGFPRTAGARPDTKAQAAGPARAGSGPAEKAGKPSGADPGRPGPAGTRAGAATPAEAGRTASGGKPGRDPARIREKEGHAWVWWTTGTLAAAALGAYFYLALAEPAPNRITAALPGPGQALP